jgi:hypothetical protein
MDKLLTSLINFGKGFSKLTSTGRLAIVAAALCIISFTVGKSESTNKLEKFNVEYSKFKTNSKKTSDYADSLNYVVGKLSDENAKIRDSVYKLSITVEWKVREAKKVSNRLPILQNRMYSPEVLADTIKLLALKDSVIENLEDQVAMTASIITDQSAIIEQKDTQIILLESAVAISTTRGDSLQTILHTLPPAAPNPNKLFGIIPKPSRKLVAITAFAVGVVAGAELRR